MSPHAATAAQPLQAVLARPPADATAPALRRALLETAVADPFGNVIGLIENPHFELKT